MGSFETNHSRINIVQTKTVYLFATHNQNKVREIRAIANDAIEVKSLLDIGWQDAIEEPFDTLEENAAIKCQTVYNYKSMNCFSEDTGLFVEALNGAPGVRSARYAGDAADNEKNIDLLLKNLLNHNNRQAYFKTVIALMQGKDIKYFTGVCKGIITTYRKGNEGFGYDKIFIPEGSQKTFAEMTLDEKSGFSHRKKAVQLLINHLNATLWQE